jgi:hypothetical protein
MRKSHPSFDFHALFTHQPFILLLMSNKKCSEKQGVCHIVALSLTLKCILRQKNNY